MKIYRHSKEQITYQTDCHPVSLLCCVISSSVFFFLIFKSCAWIFISHLFNQVWKWWDIIRLWDSPTMSFCTSVKSSVRDWGWAKPSGHPVERVIIRKWVWLESVSIPPGFRRSWVWARSALRSCGTSSPRTWSMQWKVSNAAEQTIIFCLMVCVCIDVYVVVHSASFWGKKSLHNVNHYILGWRLDLRLE